MRNIAILIISAALSAAYAGALSHAQTEGFNVKTPVQTISDNSSKLINEISADAKKDPETSIPRNAVCSAECYLVIPSIQPVSGRDDFAGTGLLGCRHADSGKLAPPIFFQIANLDSFNESGGGLVILVMDRAGVKSVLGDQLQLTSGNTSSGIVGSEADVKNLKSFVAYARPAGEAIQAFDASGSALVFDSGDTFNAYQQELEPIDIMLLSIDVPPALRDFASSLGDLRKGCR